jgi:N-acetyl-gamma-glutamyl-phosphate reductase / acetylglutamate kinase
LLIILFVIGKEVIYSDLSEADIERMERDGEVDGWILALPNGVGARFLAAIDKGAKDRKVEAGEKKGVVVDLSADFRFETPGESEWVYGLPELYGRQPVLDALRVSNPGCYATSAQLMLAPLLEYIQPGAIPTVMGMSGYSGAGTSMVEGKDGELFKLQYCPRGLIVQRCSPTKYPESDTREPQRWHCRLLTYRPHP